MNPGIIKWNVVVTATINKDKISKKDINKIKNQIKDDNSLIELMSNDDVFILKSDFSEVVNSPYKLDFSYEGIKSLKKWFPKVIEDRDWDHHYIIDALKFKIQNTCNYIETKRRHIGWEKDVKYMRIALKLMEKLWPDMYSDEISYDSEYTNYHVSEHKFVDISKEERKESNLSKGSKRMVVTEISENFDEYFAKNKKMHMMAIDFLKRNKVYSDTKSKYTQAMVISKLKHEKARKLLFKIIETKLETWWD